MIVAHFHEVNFYGLDYCHGIAALDDIAPVDPESHFILVTDNREFYHACLAAYCERKLTKKIQEKKS